MSELSFKIAITSFVIFFVMKQFDDLCAEKFGKESFWYEVYSFFGLLSFFTCIVSFIVYIWSS